MLKRIILCIMVAMLLVSCGNTSNTGNSENKQGGVTVDADGKTDNGPLKLSFKAASSYEYLKSLNGKQVTINGYLATSSPADGSFIFLMNLPYQSCPFCVPNTSQLANTLEVYPKSGDKFDFTNQAVSVTGKLECAEENSFFTDDYGYEFAFKITDGEYSIITDTELTEELALWQKIADSGLVTDLYQMYDYVNFLCAWNTYFVDPYIDADGNECPGFYLYASDALHFLTTQYAECSADGYFEKILAEVEAYDSPLVSVLADNIRNAQQLAAEARAALENGEYTYENKYVETFDTYDDIYTINNAEEFGKRNDALYNEFANWIAGWEL